MTKRMIAIAALLLGACASDVGGTKSEADKSIDPREPVEWFKAGSRLRGCWGYDNEAGAFWSATAASLGAVDYFRRAPPSLAQGAKGRRRVNRLMQDAYNSRFSIVKRGSCLDLAEATREAYRRQPRDVRKLIASLAGSLLRTDRTGRSLLARINKRQPVPRGRRAKRAPRVRRSVLRPSEQQLPRRN